MILSPLSTANERDCPLVRYWSKISLLLNGLGLSPSRTCMCILGHRVFIIDTTGLCEPKFLCMIKNRVAIKISTISAVRYLLITIDGVFENFQPFRLHQFAMV